ncbi:hypothetical protein GCM10023195_69160 [Actinoallomurus liliacearum]|uniref:Uncharacterized protein n=1 Tax=Actinoallomurus liliacearum TaxID=1080073 RepID=A0ABP8TWM1_9ACTN
MPTGRAGRPREVDIEVDEDRSRQVAPPVRLDAGWAAESPADVEQDDVTTEFADE